MFIKECDDQNQFMTFEYLVSRTCESSIKINIEIKDKNFDVSKLLEILNK